MASAKDLAGIAALAGLGYYLVNRNKKKDEDSSTSVSSAATKAAAKAASDEDGRKPTAAEEKDMDAAAIYAEDSANAPPKVKPPYRPGQQTSGKSTVNTTVPSGPESSPSGPMKMPTRPESSPSGPMKMPTRPGQERYGSAGGRGPTAKEIAAYRQQAIKPSSLAATKAYMAQKRYKDSQAPTSKEMERDAIEPVYPEQYIGMPGIKTVASAAKTLANRGATAARPAMQAGRNSAQQAMDRAMDAEMAARTTKGTVPRPASPPPTTDFGFKQALEAQKNVKNQPGYKQMTENEMRDADLPYKRGGRVKAFASGGSVSSASSRGDGIASRGKTRGKMY